MNEKFATLKLYLSELVFARVTNTVANDENLISFCYDGTSNWNDEPNFRKNWESLTPYQRRHAEASYGFYYGFAQSSVGDIHFDSKGHSYQNVCYAGLGIMTPQQVLQPPTRFSWIVGCINKARADHVSKPHFSSWARCMEAEKVFVEYLLGGRTRFGEDDLKRLFVRNELCVKGTNRLINMALLLLAGDLDHFLRHRSKHGGEWIDPQVLEICNEFAQDLWGEYKEQALEQRIYSTTIPEPAPKSIVELRTVEGDGIPVGLNTPFTGLEF